LWSRIEARRLLRGPCAGPFRLPQEQVRTPGRARCWAADTAIPVGTFKAPCDSPATWTEGRPTLRRTASHASWTGIDAPAVGAAARSIRVAASFSACGRCSVAAEVVVGPIRSGTAAIERRIERARVVARLATVPVRARLTDGRESIVGGAGGAVGPVEAAEVVVRTVGRRVAARQTRALLLRIVSGRAGPPRTL
jgi:hypothetical protein